MNLHDLREAQANFTKRIDDVLEEKKQSYKLRSAFTKQFNINALSSLKIDDYVIGKGHHTFCYRIERELDCLGRIIGATADKFGIYYGRTKHDSTVKYRETKIWGNNYTTAYNNIIPAIKQLIQAGASNDIDTILKSRISPMFKGKILAVYYPDRYLNVFSDEHLKYFLKFYDLDTKQTLRLDPVLKREELLKFKNNDAVMKNWSADLFSYFLYTVYPKSPIKASKPTENVLEDYGDFDFPFTPIAEEVKLNIIENTTIENSTASKSKISKPDYEKQSRVNKKLGDRGEKIVEEFERERLRKAGKTKLADAVDRVSLKSDALGYDIESFEEDGSKRYIEVKATRAKVGNANFFLTINELNTAKELDNYFVYVVYDILSSSPKIWIINNPFNPQNDKIKLMPINYKVSINVKV
jgi:hypothetical protein